MAIITLPAHCRRLIATGIVALVAAAGAVLPAATTLAQTPSTKNQPMTPPTPPSGTGTPAAPWSQWLLAVGLVVLVIGVNCIPSKRGHQD